MRGLGDNPLQALLFSCDAYSRLKYRHSLNMIPLGFQRICPSKTRFALTAIVMISLISAGGVSSLVPIEQAFAATSSDSIATGNAGYDQFDSFIPSSSQKYSIKDPMIVKAMIMEESGFNPNAVSPDTPCGIPSGWSSYQSRSFGLMQITPACVQPNTQPNLTTNHHSSKWATSWFNPQYNIERGVGALSATLSVMKIKFAGCTDNQYMLMALGGYNSGEGAITGCGSWNDRANSYVTLVMGDYRTLAQMAGLPYPY